jgi:hypothetical protein
VDRHGNKEGIEAPLLAYREVRLAPDGTRAVVAVDNAGLRIWNFAQKRLISLTDARGRMEGLPVWTPDGEQIIFMSNRAQPDDLGLYVIRADGSGAAKPIPTRLRRQWPTSILARDGSLLLFGFDAGPGKQQLVIGVHLPSPSALGDGTPVVVTNLFPGVFAEVSPNGRFVAYRSGTGTPEVYVRPFPVVNGPASQIVRIGEGATGQVWARDGSKLFYLDASRLLTEVSTDTSGQTFTHGSPTRLLDTRYVSPRTNPARHYDVGPDGRFLMLDENASDENVTSPSVFIERNWLGELKERVRDSRAPQ